MTRILFFLMFQFVLASGLACYFGAATPYHFTQEDEQCYEEIRFCSSLTAGNGSNWFFLNSCDEAKDCVIQRCYEVDANTLDGPVKGMKCCCETDLCNEMSKAPSLDSIAPKNRPRRPIPPRTTTEDPLINNTDVTFYQVVVAILPKFPSNFLFNYQINVSGGHGAPAMLISVFVLLNQF